MHDLQDLLSAYGQPWTPLTDLFGGALYAEAPMQVSPNDSPGWDGTNESGFTGLSGGFRRDSGAFFDAGSAGYWWTPGPGGSYAYNRLVATLYSYIPNYGNQPQFGFSVRCVRDAE